MPGVVPGPQDRFESSAVVQMTAVSEGCTVVKATCCVCAAGTTFQSNLDFFAILIRLFCCSIFLLLGRIH